MSCQVRMKSIGETDEAERVFKQVLAILGACGAVGPDRAARAVTDLAPSITVRADTVDPNEPLPNTGSRWAAPLSRATDHVSAAPRS